VTNITPYNRITIYLLAVTQPLYSLTQNNVSNKNHSNKSITHLQAKKQKHCFKICDVRCCVRLFQVTWHS